MTEPTRDALHEETLAELAIEEANARRGAALTTYDDVDWTRIAERYAYAAECVKRVPELEAEVESHTAYKLSLLDALGPGVEGRSVPDAIRALRAEVERLRAVMHEAAARCREIAGMVGDTHELAGEYARHTAVGLDAKARPTPRTDG